MALCGAKGGVGTTALALALAVVSGATLVDLADGRSDLSDLLGRRPEGTIAGLAQLGLDLDGALDSITGTHPSGLQVLAGGGHDQLDLLPQGLSASIVRALRHGRPLTLVDTGRGLAPAAREAVAAADATLLVTTPDAQAAAAARAQLLALGRVGVDQTTVAVVVNRWSRRAELSVRSLERACGAHVAAVVPESADRMAEFANARLALDRWPGRRLREPLAALVRTPPVAA